MKFIIAALVAFAAGPVSAQTLWTPQQRAETMKKLQAGLYDLNWNCMQVTDMVAVDPDHYGDVFRVDCVTISVDGEKKSLSYRVTYPKNPMAKPRDLRVEPWK